MQDLVAVVVVAVAVVLRLQLGVVGLQSTLYLMTVTARVLWPV